MTESPDTKPPRKRKSFVGHGLGIGAGIGAAVGAAVHDIPMWTAVGVAVGLALAAGIDAERRKKMDTIQRDTKNTSFL
jgi:hypothetical protein